MGTPYGDGVRSETLRSPRGADWPATGREDGFRARAAAMQRNSLPVPGVGKNVMLVAAIVFGAVGVAAGFTWDYVVKRND